jgi:hypothetical protein
MDAQARSVKAETRRTRGTCAAGAAGGPMQDWSPAMSAPDAQHLQELLGLEEDELLRVLDADPLAVITGALDHKPELPILLALLAEAEASAGPALLRRWVRAGGPDGRPLDMLLARDFAAFEDALATLAERGFVLSRRRGPGASRPATSP